MGNEFGQSREWDHKGELDWFLLEHAPHKGVQECVKDLNALLTSEPALYGQQFKTDGFQWIDLNHRSESVIVYRRLGPGKGDDLLVLLNLTPVPRLDWQVSMDDISYTKEVFNSDDEKYWGTGKIFNPDIRIEKAGDTDEGMILTINLPPLSGVILK